jgi:hypothetical protein
MTPLVYADKSAALLMNNLGATQTNRQWTVTRKSPDQVQDIRLLKLQLDMSRDQDLKDYFSETTKLATAAPAPTPPLVNNLNLATIH